MHHTISIPTQHRMLMEVFAAVLDVRWEDTLEEGELWGDDDKAEVEAAMASALGTCAYV